MAVSMETEIDEKVTLPEFNRLIASPGKQSIVPTRTDTHTNSSQFPEYSVCCQVSLRDLFAINVHKVQVYLPFMASFQFVICLNWARHKLWQNWILLWRGRYRPSAGSEWADRDQ